MQIFFDYSADSFKRWGPDHPEHVNWERMLPGGLFFVRVEASHLKSIVNQNSVSLNPTIIRREVSGRKWDRLKMAVQSGMPLTPPWAVLDGRGEKLFIAQGRHRFQFLIVYESPAVILSVSGELRQRLQDLGVVAEFHAPGHVTYVQELG